MPASQDSEFRRAREQALSNARRLAVGSRVWLVYEMGPLSYDRRGSALIFESESAVRRVRSFPANWRSLSDEELEELSNGR
jgi:hypothetical protein